MTYHDKLETTKTYYPFAKWRALFFPDPEDDDSKGMEQYTQENCDAAKSIFDSLISGLNSLGENARKKTK